MGKIKYICFDLDGTLTDSEPGLEKAFTYIVDKYNLDTKGKKLREFMGPPIKETLDIIVEDKSIIEDIILDFRQYYDGFMLELNSVYAGIEEMLKVLNDMGYKLAVVTGKPQKSCEEVINHFGLSKYFDSLWGVPSGATKKIVTLNSAIVYSGCNVSEVVMVGDRLHDLEAAERAGCGGIGVTWGYGTREELSNYSNLLLADFPKEIVEYFSNQ